MRKANPKWGALWRRPGGGPVARLCNANWSGSEICKIPHERFIRRPANVESWHPTQSAPVNQTMSQAGDTFAQSILDAEHLLKHFNTLNSKPPPSELEVLKRAGLIMAMTAWETYVEDRLLEAAAERLRALTDRRSPRLCRQNSMTKSGACTTRTRSRPSNCFATTLESILRTSGAGTCTTKS